MSFSTTQLTALETAIATGELSVSYDGKSVTYRSMRELREAYDFVRGKLIEQGTISADATPRRAYAIFAKD